MFIVAYMFCVIFGMFAVCMMMFCVMMPTIAIMSVTVSPYMYAEVYAEADKECCGCIAYPFLYFVHPFADNVGSDSAIRYEPSDDHYW